MSKNFRLARPIAVHNRNGRNVTDGFIDMLELEPLGENDVQEPALLLSCARSLVDADGNPVEPADLEGLNLRAALRAAFLAHLPPGDLFQASEG